MKLRRLALALLFSGALLAAGGGEAMAAAQPNENFRNCRGVIVSTLATSGAPPGQIAKTTGGSVRELQQGLRVLCEQAK